MPSLDRSPEVQDAMRWLIPNPNLPDHLQEVSGDFHELGENLVKYLKDGPQLVRALYKLTEAKDCAVRARIASE